MAIPRQLIVIAASAAVTGLLLYARNRMREEEERAQAARKDNGGRSPGPAPKTAGQASSSTPQATASAPRGGAAHELSQFLAGETWHDETGWKGIWGREAVAAPDAWLRSAGTGILAGERAKLAHAPALLAGCRRRWIVVCRYAGISVDDAAALWTSTDA